MFKVRDLRGIEIEWVYRLLVPHSKPYPHHLKGALRRYATQSTLHFFAFNSRTLVAAATVFPCCTSRPSFRVTNGMSAKKHAGEIAFY
jgi:hypothetical protein